ncbi:MAG: Maf family protein [Pseudomonadota bacterium]
MKSKLILASGSQIRRELLERAGLEFEIHRPDVDEDPIKRAAEASRIAPERIAQSLADAKALSLDASGSVIGSDQVLSFAGAVLSKPDTRDTARRQLQALRGGRHHLHTAVTVALAGEVRFQHVTTVSMTMRSFSDAFLDGYLDRNWPEIGSCVGGYMIEAEGSRLFEKIDGDYFSVLGLPLLPLMNFLSQEGVIPA